MFFFPLKLENCRTLFYYYFVCLYAYWYLCVETHALRNARGGVGGGGGGLKWASGCNFPLFLVYPVDMPEEVVDFLFQVTFESVGGLQEHIMKLKEMVVFPLLYPEFYERFSVAPSRGVLFYGPPGTWLEGYIRLLGFQQSCPYRNLIPYSPGYTCVSSANRDPDSHAFMSSGTIHWYTRARVAWVCRHWLSSTHLRDVFTSCKLRHQKLRSLDFLPMEIVTKMRQQQRRVQCWNTKDQCNTAKMAGEWNTPTRGTVTKQIGLLTYFQLITMIRNCQKRFILHLAWSLIPVSAAFLI